jgi:hypothetical protein
LATDDGRTADAPSRNRQPVPEVCNGMIAQLRILLCECLTYTKRRERNNYKNYNVFDICERDIKHS